MAEGGVWVVGDPQGWLEPLSRILGDVGLIDAERRWTGRSATLVIAGDLVDRGPDGVGVIDLLMRLQSSARAAGGAVQVVIGNHDVLLLAAQRFGGAFYDDWLAAGGVRSDLELLSATQLEWLRNLPALLLVDDAVVAHADALFYREYGSSVAAVNAEFARILHSDSAAEWRLLLDRFGEHRAFLGAHGEANLGVFLDTFGASRLVHGHSPIARTLNVAPESVTAAYVYHGGRCISVDPGLYLGGPGFAFRLR
jgi:diadenosine tetraphosphatase ApaH/serine/threonine PP2A family protein phosphatase